MNSRHSVFWDDLAADLEDPEYLREYVSQSVRIATIDRVVNALEVHCLVRADYAVAHGFGWLGQVDTQQAA